VIQKIKKIVSIAKDIYQLPKATINFKEFDNMTITNYKKTYEYFTKPHRLKIFKNKTIGVALIDLNFYKDFEEYYKSINGKNSSAYYSRKAIKRNYIFQEIDRNEYVDDIYEINISAKVRQGKEMSSSYLDKKEHFCNDLNYRYFGVIDEGGILVSYCNIGFYGEFSLVVTLLGHKKYLNDGIMYLMMLEVNKLMFTEYKSKGYKYIMYDTFFGASDGLKKFKTKLGFKPYKVKWKWIN